MEDLLKKKLTRKDFLKKSCLFCLGLGLSSSIIDLFSKSKSFAKDKESFSLHEARFYKKIDELTVQCELCHRGCTLSNGTRSFCRAREPKEGKLYSLVYGRACAVHIDPIEKKPLFHFLPGTPIFSVATSGCNFRCKFCQNWQISQVPPEETYNEELSPQEIVEQTLKNNCPSIAYTYTEPSIFYEYMLDTARLAKIKGIKNMYHSNGSLNQKPVEELSLYLDGANVDLKGFTQEFYSEVCAGYLETVLETLKTLKKNGVWLEITNLIVPTLNDDLDKIKQMCIWIKENLGSDVPIHFSRFWPQYKLTTLNPTPAETLEKARQIAQDVGLNFVYLGNIPGNPAENTYCPRCKKALIQRSGFSVLSNNIINGRCKFCGRQIPGVWA
jgi:pyruvate formate lyase activating enzyme